ncbi:MAG TPA: NADP oxidoreductase, partial [Thauera sp.]|nr:NADP oxidoreductase [Thauera sp.]
GKRTYDRAPIGAVRADTVPTDKEPG